MRRYPSRELAYSFGPGPWGPAVKALIWANIGMFLLPVLWRPAIGYLALVPAAVVEEWWIWQIFTYMFLHGGVGHILFNMLALWMFGTELERLWGTRFFVRYYFACGLAAGAATVLVGMTFGGSMYYAPTVGASGAIYGLLLAYGLIYPDRLILFWLFPVPAKYAVMIMGGISFFSAISGTAGGIAHVAHLGGLVAGYLILRGRRLRVAPELKYWYLRWKMNRQRRRFGVYPGQQDDDWNRRIH